MSLDLSLKILDLQESKTDASVFEDFKTQLTHKLKNDYKKYEYLRDTTLTLENYCERYIPIVTINTVKDLILPVLERDQQKKLILNLEKLHFKQTMEITEDRGDGTIFKRISEINEFCNRKL